MKKQNKKVQRSLIDFARGDDNEAVALAMMGLSNKCIQSRTQLSSGQITYRLHKAKTVEQNKHGYRVEYRNGESTFAMQLINDIAGVLREEVRRKITPRIVHPVP